MPAEPLAEANAKIAHALALTDVNSAEFKAAFCRELTMQAWRVVEKFREALQ